MAAKSHFFSPTIRVGEENRCQRAREIGVCSERAGRTDWKEQREWAGMWIRPRQVVSGIMSVVVVGVDR